MFKIEDGVPIPAPYSFGGGLLKYPWPDLKVGQSFVVEDGYKKRGGMYAAAARFGLRIRTKREGTLLRVWRVE